MFSPTKPARLALTAALLSLPLASSVHAAPTVATPATPLQLAEQLVANVQPADSVYVHRPSVVTWGDATGKTGWVCRTDCSGLINELIKKAYGVSDENLATWLGAKRPVARSYEHVIEKQDKFVAINQIGAIQPGDIIAIDYPKDNDNTGHIAIVDAAPQAFRAVAPLIPGTTQWAVKIIDSTSSGHGVTDTRHLPDGTFRGGVGAGNFRLYSDASGKIVGYTWSTSSKGVYYDQVSPDPTTGRRLAVGRLALPVPTLTTTTR